MVFLKVLVVVNYKFAVNGVYNLFSNCGVYVVLLWCECTPSIINLCKFCQVVSLQVNGSLLLGKVVLSNSELFS